MSAIPESVEYHIFNIPTILIMSWIVWLIIFILSFLAVHKFSPVPKKIQNLIEYILENIYSLADSVIGEHKIAKKYYPLFISIFLYIFLGNLIGLIPGFVSPTSTLSTTIALSVVVFVYYNYQGISTGGFGYIKHFFSQIDLKKVPLLLKPAMAIFGFIIIPLIELISHLARPLSLSVRLFGNILAKEVLLGILALLVVVFSAIQSPFIKVILTIAPVILRPLIILLGTLVSLIQAGVFTILSMIYVAGAVMMHNSESHSG